MAIKLQDPMNYIQEDWGLVVGFKQTKLQIMGTCLIDTFKMNPLWNMEKCCTIVRLLHILKKFYNLFQCVNIYSLSMKKAWSWFTFLYLSRGSDREVGRSSLLNSQSCFACGRFLCTRSCCRPCFIQKPFYMVSKEKNVSSHMHGKRLSIAFFISASQITTTLSLEMNHSDIINKLHLVSFGLNYAYNSK